MSNVSGSPADAEVTYQDMADHRCNTRLEYGPWMTRPSDVLPVRQVTDLKTSAVLLQKVIPADSAESADIASKLLENEARVAYRLSRLYRSAYPRELVRLIGHNLDADEPFVLYEMRRGHPVTERPSLGVVELRAFHVSLLRAVLALSDGGVVHSSLTPETVWWDGQHVQVGDFAFAAFPDEMSQRHPAGRWASPEQRNGAAAGLQDDIWSLSAVIYSLASGRQPQHGTPPNLRILGPALAGQLEGVFVSPPTKRPDIRALLDRARVPADPPIGTAAASDASFQDGLEAFDRILNEKRAAIAPAIALKAAPAPPPQQEKRRGWRLRGTASLMIVLAQLFLKGTGS